MSAQTDRELLELAAKALGWRVTAYSERRSTGVVDGGMAIVVADGRVFGWSPLHNDGDALRLAVKLRITITYRGNAADCFVAPDDSETWSNHVQPWGGDCGEDAAATRRAIVRAAAATGQKGGA